MLKRPLSAGGTRKHWSRRPVVAAVALTWTLLVLTWIKLGHKHFLGQAGYIHTAASQVKATSSSSGSHGSRGGEISSNRPAAACNEAALPSPQEVEDMFLTRWGRKACLPLRKACLDQGTVVMYQARPDGSWPLEDFQLGDHHLDFRGFGDIVGIIQYPRPILRPGTSDEEAPDLRTVKDGGAWVSPVFSNCSRPVVLFHNHLFMFGDFFMRIMPTYISAVKAHTWPPEHTPAWDTRLSLVLATGGQRMARWQKLMLAPLSQHPIVTLSAASSRTIPLQHQQHQQQQQEDQAGWSGDVGLAGGRCFESLTLCGLNNPRGFPGSIDRPTWEGAQLIKTHWLARYGAYSYLPPDHALQQPGAFRVVFAVRDLAREAAGSPDLGGSVRALLNLPQLLQWCNRWRPVGVDGRPDARYSRTVCVAHEFGRHGQVFAEGTEPPAELPADPELDPRALLLDFAVADNADVMVGLHGAQLMNAFFMPERKSLVEVRPFAFNLGWPAMYFKEPIIEIDKAEGIFWWGIDTTQKANSRPGMWEAKGQGCCHERDRHTKIEPAALEYLFRRIIHSRQNSSSYMELVRRGEHFITDTLASGTKHEYEWEDMGELEQLYADPAVAVPKPPHWGGFLVRPLAVEFWQGRPSRLHDRLRYSRSSTASSDWQLERLYP